MKDPAFLADAAKEKLEINPVSAADIEQLLKESYQLPKSVVATAARLVNPSN